MLGTGLLGSIWNWATKNPAVLEARNEIVGTRKTLEFGTGIDLEAFRDECKESLRRWLLEHLYQRSRHCTGICFSNVCNELRKLRSVARCVCPWHFLTSSNSFLLQGTKRRKPLRIILGGNWKLIFEGAVEKAWDGSWDELRTGKDVRGKCDQILEGTGLRSSVRSITALKDVSFIRIRVLDSSPEVYSPLTQH